MTGYVAFLRGINLGPSNRVAMPRLRTMAEGLGYADVRTCLSSGNLLFSATGAQQALSEQLRQAISSEFGLSIDVTVRTEARLRQILAGDPYPDGNPSQVTVAFLTGSPPPGAQQQVQALATAAEPFTFAGTEVWVNYTDGIAKSKLALQFSRAVGVSATVRTVRTVGRVVALFA